MNKTSFTTKAIAFLVFTFAFATAAQAQASRTWVSGTGDDANPCSRTAPCKTFAGAISKTADQGEIDCIDSGCFGTVTITKSITIDGGGTFASILAAGTNGVNVNDSGSGAPMTKIVRLRNISINGFGTGFIGINYTSAKTVYVENCQIFGFKAGSGHGISANLTADGGQLLVRDSIIAENLGDGIRSTTTTGLVKVEVLNTRVDKSANGFHGLHGTSATLSGSAFSYNTTNGVQLEDAAGVAAAQIDNCTMFTNANGVTLGAGPVLARLSGNLIVSNTASGVNLAGGTGFTYGDNKIRGNGASGTNDVQGGTLNNTTTKQ